MQNSNLLQQFGLKGQISNDFIELFLKIIKTDEKRIIFNKWKLVYNKIYGDFLKVRNFDNKFLNKFKLKETELPLFLLAVQTYYNLVVKLTSLLILHHRNTFKNSNISLNTSKLQSELIQLENGNKFNNFKLSNFTNGDLFSWYLSYWNNDLKEIITHLIDLISEINFYETFLKGTPDKLQYLYQNLIPQQLRHQLGEFYTPEWLANHLLSEIEFEGDPSLTVLDPCCGSGIFIIKEIEIIKINALNQKIEKKKIVETILNNVVGFEINPIALISTKFNYLLSILDLLPDYKGNIELPIYNLDILSNPPYKFKFDHVIGNPPWINWEDLDKSYRESLIKLWKNYGLFSLKGNKARLGGGRKDISMLFTYAVADKFLKNSGKLGFLITQSVFKTLGAGEGFRRFQIGNDKYLKVLKVIDYVDAKPFQYTNNMTSALILEKGSKTTYPIIYKKIINTKDLSNLKFDELKAEPITKPTSPWFTTSKKLLKLKRLIGPSEYVGYLGLNTGGANGIYWVDILKTTGKEVVIKNKPEEGKKKIEEVKSRIESKVLYPLIKSRNLRKWKIIGDCIYCIIVQNPKKRKGILDLNNKFPLTFEYLKKWEDFLNNRAMYKKYFDSSKAPFYTMFNIGTYTFAPFKVVWNRMGNKLNASVLEQFDSEFIGKKPIIPDNVLTFIPFENETEAHYVCAIINSKLILFLIQNFSLKGGKSFAPPSILKFLSIPKYTADNEIHKDLAVLSEKAHAMVNNKGLDEIEEKINYLVSNLYKLSDSESHFLNEY